MKKLIFIISICSLLLSQQTIAQELKSEFLFDLEINLDPPQVVGPILKGTRLISPFKDGLVKAIDPLHSSGTDLHDIIFSCTKTAIGEVNNFFDLPRAKAD